MLYGESQRKKERERDTKREQETDRGGGRDLARVKERERVTEGATHRAREKEIQNKQEKRDRAKTIGTCTTGHTAEKGG